MPEIVEFDLDGQKRSFILALSPDWAEHFGDLALVIALHDVGQSAEEFYEEAELEALIAGTFDVARTPMVVLVPRGLTIGRIDSSAAWNCGPLGGPFSGLMAVDDVAMIVQSVIWAQTALHLRLVQLTFAGPPYPFPVEFFSTGRKLMLGRGAGGQLALRFHAEVLGHLVPPSWTANLVPNTIAVVATSAGGLEYASETAPPHIDTAAGAAANPSFAGASLVQWTPGAVVSNLLQLHNVLDLQVEPEGGVSAGTKTRIDERMGGLVGAGDGFYRWDLQPGPDETNVVGAVPGGVIVNPPNVTGTALEPWLPAGVASIPKVIGNPVVAQGWGWVDAAGFEVRYLLCSVSRLDGHVWPNGIALDPFSATAEAWAFLQSHP
jgi:hypothetical protein